MQAALLAGVAAFFFLLSVPKKAGGTVKPEKSLVALAEKWAKHYGIDAAIVKGVIWTESAWNPSAVNREKSASEIDDSIGLMQVTRAVFQDFGLQGLTEEQMLNPDLNIQVGAWKLASLVKRHGFTAGVQMYNVGERGYLKLQRRNAEYLARVTRFMNRG